MLREGHAQVKLSSEELDKLCAWIDLNIPYCGGYDEANAWNDGEKNLFAKRMEERQRNEAVDQRNIKAMIAR
jgi:hypothetical protein